MSKQQAPETNSPSPPPPPPPVREITRHERDSGDNELPPPPPPPPLPVAAVDVSEDDHDESESEGEGQGQGQGGKAGVRKGKGAAPSGEKCGRREAIGDGMEEDEGSILKSPLDCELSYSKYTRALSYVCFH
jgi:hypothetical protein